MKNLLFSCFLATAVMLPGPTQPPGTRGQKADEKHTSQKIDGAWTVVYIESDGKKLADKSVTNVAVKDGVLHFQRDGQDQAWRLDFGPNQAVKATDVSGIQAAPPVTTQMQVGVYIASPEYLCFALNRWTTDTKTPKGIGEEEEEIQPVSAQDRPAIAGQHKAGPVGCSFVLILRRQ